MGGIRATLFYFNLVVSLTDACAQRIPDGKATGTRIIVTNPYKNVEWASFKQHKAALHVHTLQSDGYHMVDEVVRNYHKADFTILALTDHDKMEPNAQFARGRIDFVALHRGQCVGLDPLLQ